MKFELIERETLVILQALLLFEYDMLRRESVPDGASLCTGFGFVFLLYNDLYWATDDYI